MPDGFAPAITGSRPPARRRTLVLAGGLALAVVAGSVVALRSGLLPFGGPCDGNSTRLAVAAAPDIAPALEAVARTARDGAIRTDGACLDVEITARAAHDLADAFAQRPADPEFQVWIPDSSLWTARVGAERGTPLTIANGSADPTVVRRAGGHAPQPASAGPADPPTGKELQALMGMWTVTVQSTRLTTVVDASASMGTPVPGRGGRTRMELARNALLRTLATCTPDDEFGLWTFATFLDGASDYTEVSPTGRLGDRVTGGGTHRDTLTAALHSLTPVARSGAGLYDTTLAAYEQARATYASGKVNALVLVTDGAHDDAGSIGLGSLVARLTRLADPERPVPLIALGLGPDADLSALDRIVAATGRSAHRVDDPSQIQRVILKPSSPRAARDPAEPAPPPLALPLRYAPSVAACRGPGTADRPPTAQATGQVCTGVPVCISSP
ncbi:hypothetical protein [Streptomyces sp. NPDC055299]